MLFLTKACLLVFTTLLLAGFHDVSLGQTLDVGFGEFEDRTGQELRYSDPYRAINVHGGGTLKVDLLDWLNNGQLVTGQPGTITVSGENSLLETRLTQSDDPEKNLTLFLSLGKTRVADGGRISTWQSFVHGAAVEVDNGIFDSGFALTLAPDSASNPSALQANNSVVAARFARLSGNVSLSGSARMWLASANVGADFGRGDVVLSENSILGIGTADGDDGVFVIGTSLREDSSSFQFPDTASRLIADSSQVLSTRAQVGLTERQSFVDNSLAAFGKAEVELNNSSWTNKLSMNVENGYVSSIESVIESGSVRIDGSEEFSARFEMTGGSLTTIAADTPGASGGLSLYGGGFTAAGGATVQLDSFEVGEQNLSGVSSPSADEQSDVIISGGSRLNSEEVAVNAGLGNSTLLVDGVGSSLNATNIIFDAGNFISQQVGDVDVSVANGASMNADLIALDGDVSVTVSNGSTMRARDFLFIQNDATLTVDSDSYLRIEGLGISRSSASSESLLQLDGRLDVDRVYDDFIQDGGKLVFDENLGVTVFDGDYWLQDSAEIEFNIQGILIGDDYGSVEVLGVARLDGVLDVNLIDEFNPTLGDTLQLFAGQIDGDYKFDFANAQLGQGLRFDTTSFRSTGFISVVAVPEPSSFMLLSVCTFACCCLRRKSRLQFSV